MLAAANAADTGKSAAAAVFTTYIRDGITAKNAASYRPYFTADLYRLTIRWLDEPQKPGKIGYECNFDSDPFLGIQNGAPKPPVTVGSPFKLGALTVLPVTVQLKFNGPKTYPHQIDVAVATEHGVAKVADIISVVDGKADPTYSMRSSLARFAKDPACR